METLKPKPSWMIGLFVSAALVGYLVPNTIQPDKQKYLIRGDVVPSYFQA